MYFFLITYKWVRCRHARSHALHRVVTDTFMG
jgi:hypothetical protein